MILRLVVPDSHREISGGNLYNESLKKYSFQLGVDIETITISAFKNTPIPEGAILLVDGLLANIWKDEDQTNG